MFYIHKHFTCGNGTFINTISFAKCSTLDEAIAVCPDKRNITKTGNKEWCFLPINSNVYYTIISD